jgi:hypothetical protein
MAMMKKGINAKSEIQKIEEEEELVKFAQKSKDSETMIKKANNNNKKEV